LIGAVVIPQTTRSQPFLPIAQSVEWTIRGNPCLDEFGVGEVTHSNIFEASIYVGVITHSLAPFFNVSGWHSLCNGLEFLGGRSFVVFRMGRDFDLFLPDNWRMERIFMALCYEIRNSTNAVFKRTAAFPPETPRKLPDVKT